MQKKLSPAETLREAYQQWIDSRGERYDLWVNLASPSFRFTSVGDGPGRPDFFKGPISREQMRDYIVALVTGWEMIEFRVDEIVGEGDSVVVRSTMDWKNRGTGKSIRSIKLDHWRFRDGEAVELYESFDTAALMAALQP